MQINGKTRLAMLFFDDSIVPKNWLNSYIFDHMFNLECFVGYSKSISNNGVGVIFRLALFPWSQQIPQFLNLNSMQLIKFIFLWHWKWMIVKKIKLRWKDT